MTGRLLSEIKDGLGEEGKTNRGGNIKKNNDRRSPSGKISKEARKENAGSKKEGVAGTKQQREVQAGLPTPRRGDNRKMKKEPSASKPKKKGGQLNKKGEN